MTDRIGYISTGGGAFLEFLEGKKLPAVADPRRKSGEHELGARLKRSTKIVATLGPASSDPAVLERMIRAGVDVVRLNFSHGTAEDHLKRAETRARNRPQDRPHRGHHGRPPGPEDPRGQVQGRQDRLKPGENFILDATCEMGDATRVGLDYKELPRDVGPATCSCSTTARSCSTWARCAATRSTPSRATAGRSPTTRASTARAAASPRPRSRPRTWTTSARPRR